MDISIIGAGNVGTALATSFRRAGHTVIIASRDPEDAGSLAAATGAGIAASNADAAARGQIVVLAIPFASAASVAVEIADAVAGKPVIDATNFFFNGAATTEIYTSAGLAQAQGRPRSRPSSRTAA
jgi:predicted dinucleotide-binding enzyme